MSDEVVAGLVGCGKQSLKHISSLILCVCMALRP
jgi:hypothetical protein